jgi:hypothetical protein
MKIIRRISVVALAMVVTASAFAGELQCNTGKTEEFQYSWRLRGGVRFLAGLMFPTSGVGNLKTTYGEKVHSELLITAPSGKKGGFYAYESDMDERGQKTFMTYHGYAWGKKSRNERTVFDYTKGQARIHKVTPDETENMVRKLPDADQFRDILTAIHFLRANAKSINRPIQTAIFSDGKEYPVVFRPGERKMFNVEGKSTPAMAFDIIDAPGGKKWPGGVKVWLSSDERRIPVRIEITQSLASLQLDLKSAESCQTMVAGL